jgi:hypothetical protein
MMPFINGGHAVPHTPLAFFGSRRNDFLFSKDRKKLIHSENFIFFIFPTLENNWHFGWIGLLALFGFQKTLFFYFPTLENN